jgi:hypothetical protein
LRTGTNQAQRRGRREIDAAGIDAHHRVHRSRLEALRQQLDRSREQPRISQHGSDVFELNPGFGEIRNVADGPLDVGKTRS